MNRFLLSSLSLVLGFSIVTPGFAFFSVPGTEGANRVARQTRRHIVNRAEATNAIPAFIPQEDRSRSAAVQSVSGRNLLRRAEGRRLRSYNRMPKPGTDSYRILNLRPNTRRLRTELESSLELPSTLVQTGGYDKPTRRDIRENLLFNRVHNRDRNILNEIKESSR